MLKHDGEVWVYWKDPESGKRKSALAERVTSSGVMLKQVEDKNPERIKVLDVLEFIQGEEHKARLSGSVNEREPPTTRKKRK
jgi:hypothetical protein